MVAGLSGMETRPTEMMTSCRARFYTRRSMIMAGIEVLHTGNNGIPVVWWAMPTLI